MDQLKHDKGLATRRVDVAAFRDDVAGFLRAVRDGFTCLGVTTAHLATLTTLPRHHHRDPFDHLLIAQAIAEGATFLSEDGKMKNDPVPLLRPSA